LYRIYGILISFFIIFGIIFVFMDDILESWKSK